MEEEALKNYTEAKRISDIVQPFARSLIKENEKLLTIAEKIEDLIRKSGGMMAFPVNLSVNADAAHYTPDINDTAALKAGDLVKVDFGVQVKGYIWDRAFTICVGKETHPLIEASEIALKEALKLIKPGTKVCEISEVVEDTIKKFGFNPIHNLCGHGLEQYVQHSSPVIPNGKNNIQEKLEEGRAVAMEVFATNGPGMVKESSQTLIFKFKQERPVRSFEARKILEASVVKFEGLPFAKRWLSDIATPLKIDMALRQLLEIDSLTEYPVLREEGKGLVAQTEETVLL